MGPVLDPDLPDPIDVAMVQPERSILRAVLGSPINRDIAWTVLCGFCSSVRAWKIGIGRSGRDGPSTEAAGDHVPGILGRAKGFL